MSKILIPPKRYPLPHYCRGKRRGFNRNYIIFIAVLLLILLMRIPSVCALEITRPLMTDHRIQVVPFEENNVVPVEASTFTTTQIVFGKSEAIENIQNGDLDAWTVSVQKGLPNMLFLKPTILGSHTNMTVVTNHHTYYFQLNSQIMRYKNSNANALVYLQSGFDGRGFLQGLL